jgi:NitT/TauT family transport system substrate-binding protein
MKKIIVALIVILGLTACTPKPQPDVKLTVMAPKGAPAVTLIPLLNDTNDRITLVDGTELLTAELIKGEMDLIVAPINLGVKLIEEGNANYELAAVLTWGNVYIIDARPAISVINDPEPLAMFGVGSVPEMILNTVNDKLPFNFERVPFASVADVRGQLLADAFRFGVLAEPIASATMAAATAAGKPFLVVSDLQELWKSVTGFDNYPQAALFVRTDLDQQSTVTDRIARMAEYVTSIDADPQLIARDITTWTPASLGLPSAGIVVSAWEKLNVEVKGAGEIKAEIEAFLTRFNISISETTYFQP